ncbi:DUF2625 family protein [Plantactinospora veratri]|uniref:DUF2625 family protein n=1 Tax=Plantactinospora veratri TaxID=1436122 RepID=A0ABU7SD47_9ACTN
MPCSAAAAGRWWAAGRRCRTRSPGDPTSGGTAEFYESQRWPGWHAEVEQLAASHGLAVYPFLWSSEAQADLAATSRRPAPIRELFAMQDETVAFLAASADAGSVRIDV